jgi:hypothetical protein
VELSKGVLKLAPVAIAVPPVAVLYQFIVPALQDADKATIPGPQLKPGVIPVIIGTVNMVACTAVRALEAQFAMAAST